MKIFLRVCAALGAVLAVAVPVASADDGGGQATKPAVTCGRTAFAGEILRVGVDALAVRPGDSDSPKAIIVRLDDETIVKKGDTVVGRSALAAGKRARFYARVCRSEDRRVLTAKVITLRADPPAAGPTTTPPPSTEPKPTPATEPCGQGEMDTVLVAVSATSITVQTSSSEGVKEWPLTVNGDTVVRKSDQTVSLSVLKPGDRVHVVLARCPSGSVRALRIVFIPTKTVTPPPPVDTCTNAEGNVTLVSIGTGFVKVSTSATDGVGSSVTVNGDTIIRKNDQNVALAALAPGDLVRIAIVRCTSGSVKARSIVFLHSATPTT